MINHLGPLLLLAIFNTVLAGDINRQSIIFNEKTPDVFYCPQVIIVPGRQNFLCIQNYIAGKTDLHRQNVGEI